MSLLQESQDEYYKMVGKRFMSCQQLKEPKFCADCRFLLSAIHNTIMELRVEIKMVFNENRGISAEGVDELLYGLTETIWHIQKDVLNIKE